MARLVVVSHRVAFPNHPDNARADGLAAALRAVLTVVLADSALAAFDLRL
jgi:hypothetical protein